VRNFSIDDIEEIKTFKTGPVQSIILTKKDKIDKISSLVQLLIIPDILGGRPTGYIHHVNTAQKHRGKNLASDLVKEAIQVSKDKGCYKLFLICDKSLIDFYQKAGMKEKQSGMEVRFA
jgi:GNAT superfamily N-acetyltransferase